MHRRHDEYFLLLNGQAAVGLHDLREGSPTFGRSQMILLDGAQPTALTFPPGIVHGWYFSSEALHLQAVSEPYASYHHDDNWGCRYDDPELELQWPATPLRLSERAQSFGSLRALKAALAASAALA